MGKISFTKMSGAGNDFIFFQEDITLNAQIIKKLCDRRNGIGADGVIKISPSDQHDFNMIYYNSDGSTGSLCGNGARCAIKFAEVTGKIKNKKTSFVSNGELYSGEIIDNVKTKFFLNLPQHLKLNFKITAGGQSMLVNYINTGSPHVVIKIEDILKDAMDSSSGYKDLNLVPVYDLGKEIRYHADFLPEGANVNFILIKEGRIFIRTYERGVEDETLACGTGAVASAIISSINFGLKPPVDLITRGNDELVVDFINDKNNISNVSLTGPARITFTGEILINDFF